MDYKNSILTDKWDYHYNQMVLLCSNNNWQVDLFQLINFTLISIRGSKA